MDRQHWRDRMVEIKRAYGHEPIVPPEPKPRRTTLEPGFAAFAYRLGWTPRSPEALFGWRSRMVPVAGLDSWRARYERRQALIADFMALRAQFEPPVPPEHRDGYGPAPSEPASRLVPPLPLGMAGGIR